MKQEAEEHREAEARTSGQLHCACVHAQQAGKREMHLSKGSLSNPGEAQPWEKKPHLLLLLPSQTSKRG